ncbi:hypothetical protein CcCBS67573_g01751 [Chytriomyces confervae]|uniref:gluconokinase n=1 Tax=Chytriomyces confervae TaxID=246404 RepID=A0A507FND7_9FUNG|nr:hypothetical protein CcCBS67573_g01751 [Chytriomyces confervae]
MKLAVVVMGVSGCGKSTFEKKLAGIADQREGLRSVFIEGDDLHSDTSKRSMAQGIPLTDADREPWLKAVRKYRDTLRDSLSGCEVRFVYLKVERDVLVTRLQNREGHFVGVSLLHSQLGTFEEPVPSIERDVVTASDAASMDSCSIELFIAVVCVLAPLFSHAAPNESKSGSILSVLATLPECSQMSAMFAATKANTFISGIMPNLTLALNDGNSPPPPYTIIAFTNDASTAATKNNAQAATLISGTPANQASLLTYHILPNVLVDFNAGPVPTFVRTYLSRYGSGFNNLGSGLYQSIKIVTENGNARFTTGVANGVVQRSIKTDYGIIHVVSEVMLIPSDIVSLYTNLRLTDYLGYVNAGNLSISLKSLQGITVLIPAQGGIPRFLENNKVSDISSALKASIVQYQIISGIFYSDVIGNGPITNKSPQTTYFNGQEIFAPDSTHFASSSSSDAPKLTITTPDILFDSGVIHIVDTILLPPTVPNAQATPSPNALTQMYPPGLSPSDKTPLGNDFPVGAVVGGIVAGVVVIGIAAGLFVVIRRRKMIALLEQEKQLREIQMDEWLGGRRGSGAGDGADAAAAADAARSSRRASKAAHDDEEDEDEEDEEETEDGAMQASYDQIMDYRRALWSSGDDKQKPKGSEQPAEENAEKRMSTASSTSKKQKRVSIVDAKQQTEFLTAGGVNSNNNRRISSAVSLGKDKRKSTASGHSAALSDIIISDAKEAKKEAVRNSWWSNTGVGNNTADPAVLEAQAIREEARKSWWSGSNEVAEQLATLEAQNKRSSIAGLAALSDKRRSAASNAGERRKSRTGSAFYQSALGTGDQGLEGVTDKRRSWMPNRASALIDSATVDGSSSTDKESETKDKEKDNSDDANASALAFVVGK